MVDIDHSRRLAQFLQALKSRTTRSYAALARRTGVSSSTLHRYCTGESLASEYRPVELFAIACGADRQELRELHRLWLLADVARHHTLTQPVHQTGPEKPGADGGGGRPTGPAAGQVPGDGPGARRWPRRLLRPLVLVPAAVLGVAAVTTALVADVPGPSRRPRSVASEPPGCPAAHPDARFSGKTYLYTRVRRAAALSAPVMRTIPAGCTVGFTGYCLGDTVTDQTAHTPDTRWFTMPDGGLIASAVIHGNPPHGTMPTPCPEALAPPASITLTVGPAPGPSGGLHLRATGTGVRIVGFSALYAEDRGPARWHQIGLITNTPPTADLRWAPPRRAASPPAGDAFTLAAVACLGGDGPTNVADAKVVTVGPTGPRVPRATGLTAQALDAATRSACQYP